MNSCLQRLFKDEAAITKLQSRLPEAFELVQKEYPGAMNVGNAREHVLLGFLMWYFGEDKIIPQSATTTEQDVFVCDQPLSIKTVTGNGGVKAKWTPDNRQAQDFMNSYQPRVDILLIRIWWNQKMDSIFYIPVEVVTEIFQKVGREHFLITRPGTNNRGVEYTRETMRMMETHPNTIRIPLGWYKKNPQHNPYKRWIEFWSR